MAEKYVIETTEGYVSHIIKVNNDIYGEQLPTGFMTYKEILKRNPNKRKIELQTIYRPVTLHVYSSIDALIKALKTGKVMYFWQDIMDLFDGDYFGFTKEEQAKILDNI